jgi:hypothetical protein
VIHRRNHPFAPSLLFALAAFYALALGVYGAVAIPVSRPPFVDDCCHPPFLTSPTIHVSPPVNYRIEWRIVTLIAGVILALVLSSAARCRRLRAGAR